MHIDVKVGVWLPGGDEPVVCHVQGNFNPSEGEIPRMSLVDGGRSDAVVLDLRGPVRRLGRVRNLRASSALRRVG